MTSQLKDRLTSGDRAALAKAITLVESTKASDQAEARDLLDSLPAGKSFRVGITGVPGAGKSTLIDALGMLLVNRGHRVAVLAVDPSSTISGGSILGDKSRMARLAVEERAFIRPSPNAGSLGGVARRTRESMQLCEAAGFDIVLVETVGVGQSETMVADMVDFFLVLALPGAGDELQGIKRGIVELADVVAVNKADGDNRQRALTACRDYASALRFLQPKHPSWQPQAVCISAVTGDGLEELWSLVEQHRDALATSGELSRLRQQQRVRWMWAEIEDELVQRFRSDPAVVAHIGQVEQAVADGTLRPASAAQQLLGLLKKA